MKKILSILALLAFITLIASCGGGNNPKSVLKKYCDAYVKGDYETCLKYNFTLQVENRLSPSRTKQRFDDKIDKNRQKGYKVLKMVMDEEPSMEKGYIDAGIVYGINKHPDKNSKKFEYEITKYVIHEMKGDRETENHVKIIKITEKIKKEFPDISFEVGDWAVADK